jgi:hypothetical protein
MGGQLALADEEEAPALGSSQRRVSAVGCAAPALLCSFMQRAPCLASACNFHAHAQLATCMQTLSPAWRARRSQHVMCGIQVELLLSMSGGLSRCQHVPACRLGPAGLRVGFAGRQAARNDDEDEYGAEEAPAWDGRGSYGGGRGIEYLERERGRGSHYERSSSRRRHERRCGTALLLCALLSCLLGIPPVPCRLQVRMLRTTGNYLVASPQNKVATCFL